MALPGFCLSHLDSVVLLLPTIYLAYKSYRSCPMYTISYIRYFFTDSNGQTRMRQIIASMKYYIADTQEEKRDVAHVHCHADQIKLGSTQL